MVMTSRLEQFLQVDRFAREQRRQLTDPGDRQSCVFGIQFEPDVMAVVSGRDDAGRSAAVERVDDDVTWLAAGQNAGLDQLLRIGREMRLAVWLRRDRPEPTAYSDRPSADRIRRRDLAFDR
jgi:hypothetical protein